MKKLIFCFCLLILLNTPVMAQNIDLTKAIILNLEFKAGGLFLKDSRIVYNYPPNLQMGTEAELQIKIFSGDGQILGQYSEFDPRVIFVDDVDAEGNLVGSTDKLQEVNWDLILPVVPEAAKIVILENEKELITINAAEILKNFCQAQNEICDPDCRQFKDPDCKIEIFSPLNIGIGGGAALLVIIILVVVFVFIRRRPKPEPPPAK